MDIRLAGAMSGVEAARRIWREWQVPIVYVTAYSDAPTLDEVNGRECYGFVAKPFHATGVNAAVSLTWKRRRAEAAVLANAAPFTG